MDAMPVSTSQAAQWRYGLPAIVLHWAIALLIAFMAGLGWTMMTIEHTPTGAQLIALHKSVGLVVLLLVAARVLWRAGHRPADLPASLPHWQVQLSHWVQWGLYACMLLVPLAGLLGAGYQRAGLAFFGLPLPRWATPDRARAELLFTVHSALVWVTVALVAVHVAGALKHLLVDRDEVFRRMWLGGRRVPPR